MKYVGYAIMLAITVHLISGIQDAHSAKVNEAYMKGYNDAVRTCAKHGCQ